MYVFVHEEINEFKASETGQRASYSMSFGESFSFVLQVDFMNSNDLNDGKSGLIIEG